MNLDDVSEKEMDRIKLEEISEEDVDKAVKELLTEIEAEPAKEPIKIHTPEFKIKGRKKRTRKPEEKEKAVLTSVKATPDQVDALVRGIANTLTRIRNTESVNPEESKNFSQAVYTVGEIHHFWDDLTFLPYLILAATGIDFALVVWNKPSLEKKKPEITTVTTETGAIADDELVKRIAGI